MAINRSDYQLRRLLQTQKRFVGMQAKIIFECRRHLAQYLNIRARTKEFLAASGDHHHLHAVIHARFKNPRIELLHHFIGIGICGRIVER